MSKKRLLQDYSEEDKTLFPLYGQRKYRSATIKCLCLTIICLLASNTFLLLQYRRASSGTYRTSSKFGM